MDHLPACLSSIENQTFKDFECIVVDNGSSDGSIEYINNYHSWVKLVSMDTNTGFARGNNIGLKESSGELIVTLNNDTELDKDWLSRLVAEAHNHPDAGMIACRICNYYQRDLIDSLGMKMCLDGMSRGAFRNRRYSELQKVPSSILFPSACAALYRREMLEMTGFFDEDFFAYCEDSDLGLRGRLAGWKAILAKDSVVFHKYSATTGKLSPLKLYLVERNHFWTVVKNFPPSLILLYIPITILRFIFQALALFKGQGAGSDLKPEKQTFQCIVAILHGIIDGFSGSIRMLKKRKNMMNEKFIENRRIYGLLKKHRMKFSELLDMK